MPSSVFPRLSVSPPVVTWITAFFSRVPLGGGSALLVLVLAPASILLSSADGRPLTRRLTSFILGSTSFQPGDTISLSSDNQRAFCT